jgi:adenosylhomocysteine nucleosidase
MILVATGLKREARLLAGPGLRVVAGGGDGARLERELEAAAPGAEAIISMGLCGALDPGLKPGDWIVALHIVTRSARRMPGSRSDGSEPASEAASAEGLDPYDPGPGIRRDERRFICDPSWSAALTERLGARAGPMLASDLMIADAAAKRAAYAATGALAVDMESHVAAAVAARHSLPFAVARVVSDAADRSLPKAAQAGMAADGSMDIAAVLGALARDPRQLPALIRVGGEAETAFRALGRGRDLVGPRVGRLDLGQLPLDVV